MSDLCVIMAHKAAENTLKRHLPIWESLHLDIIIQAPVLSIPNVGRSVLGIGRPAHHGPQAGARFKATLQHLEKLNYDRFIIGEYDSLLFQVPATKNALVGPMFFDGEPGPGFQSHIFVHPPFMVTKYILHQLNEAMPRDDAENGFWDRLLGRAIEISGVPTDDLLADGRAFSRNTIEPNDYSGLDKALAGGAFAFHGVKSNEVLWRILNRRKV